MDNYWNNFSHTLLNKLQFLLHYIYKPLALDFCKNLHKFLDLELLVHHLDTSLLGKKQRILAYLDQLHPHRVQILGINKHIFLYFHLPYLYIYSQDATNFCMKPHKWQIHLMLLRLLSNLPGMMIHIKDSLWTLLNCLDLQKEHLQDNYVCIVSFNLHYFH